MADLTGVNDTLPVRLGGVSLSSGLPDNYADVNASAQLLTFPANAGPVSPGTIAGSSGLIGGEYSTTLPTLTTGQQAAIQVDSRGRLLIVDTNFPGTVDTNYGTVGVNTIRTASQIGNATGGADFAAGNSSAQTLRVVIATNQAAIPVSQSGTWNIGTLTSITNPVAVTGTFWQTTQPVSGTVAATQSGTWTVQQGTAPWSFVGNLTNNNAAPAATNIGALTALAEGTLSATRYTTGNLVLPVVDLAGNTNVDIQYYLGAAVSKTNPIATTLSDGTNVLTAALSAYGTAPTGTFVQGVNAYITNVPAVSQSGTWNINNISGTISLPTGAATSANQATEITSLQLIDNPIGSSTGGTAGTSSNLAGGIYNTTLPTLTNGQQVGLQVDSSGRLIISPTTLAQGSLTSGQGGNLVMGAVSTNPPLYTTAQTDSLSLTIDGDLRVADIINTAGQYRAQSVTTTAAEALGAATILANRKSLTITPTNGTVYWGFSNAVTTTTGSPIFKNQSMSFAIGANLHIYVIAAATTDCRMAEGS
jgi:hypothetical protein